MVNNLIKEQNISLLPRIEVLGYQIFSSSLSRIEPEMGKILINTISPNSYGLALKDKQFENALKGSDILVLDGIGMALGSILINGKNIKKIAGQDCFDFFMDQANKNCWKVFFLGSTCETLDKIIKRVKIEFPQVEAQGYSPPFRSEFSELDNHLMLQAINLFKPELLFIGMTAPKQEKWAYAHKDLINSRVISTIGNVFDWYAGNSKRPGRIWIQLRLEWLVRILLRPEIFRRNTGNQLRFLADLILHITHLKRKNNHD